MEFSSGRIFFILHSQITSITILEFSRDHQEQSWGSRAEDKELRERLWLTSERWARYAEYLEKLRSEVGSEVFDPCQDGERGKRAGGGDAGPSFIRRWIPWI